MSLRMGVRVEFPGGRSLARLQAKGGSLAELANSAATAIARATAAQIKERRMRRGDGPEGAPYRYDTGRLRFVSPRYPIIAEGKQAENGVIVYPSSAAMHRNITPGSFNVSGGMWAGLTVRPLRRAARVQFRGRSEGQDPGKRRRGLKVSNALKAGTVLRQCRVNVLALHRHELDAIARGVTFATMQRAQLAIGVPMQVVNALPSTRYGRAIATSLAA